MVESNIIFLTVSILLFIHNYLLRKELKAKCDWESSNVKYWSDKAIEINRIACDDIERLRKAYEKDIPDTFIRGYETGKFSHFMGHDTVVRYSSADMIHVDKTWEAWLEIQQDHKFSGDFRKLLND